MPAVHAHHLEDTRAHAVRQPRKLSGRQRLHLGGRHFATSGTPSRRVSSISVVAFCPKFGSYIVQS